MLTGWKKNNSFAPALWTITGSTISVPTDLTATSATDVLHVRPEAADPAFVYYGTVLESVTGSTPTGITPAFSIHSRQCGLAVEPTGMTLLASVAADPGNKISTDGGATWSDVTTLPTEGTRAVSWALTDTLRWVSASATIQYTNDGWVTAVDKTGNLTDFVPSPNITYIKVIA